MTNIILYSSFYLYYQCSAQHICFRSGVSGRNFPVHGQIRIYILEDNYYDCTQCDLPAWDFLLFVQSRIQSFSRFIKKATFFITRFQILLKKAKKIKHFIFSKNTFSLKKLFHILVKWSVKQWTTVQFFIQSGYSGLVYTSSS